MNRLRKVNAIVWTLALVCLLAACAGDQAPPAPAATGNPTQPTQASSAAASPLPVQRSPDATTPIAAPPTVTQDKAAHAKALADRLTGAVSDQARYEALLAVMQALGVGVYTSDGQAVVSGAERGPNDFYLYDFELRLVAGSLARKDSESLEDLAAVLNTMGGYPVNQPLSADVLWASIQAGTRAAAQQPTGRVSLVPLLVRELGLRKATPYDVLQTTSYQDLPFDALQQFLILADLTLPLVRQVWPISAVPSQRVANLDGLLTLRPVALQDACADLVGRAMSEGWFVGIFPLGIPPGATTRQIARQIIQRFHDWMLASAIDVSNLTPIPAQTHYGHAQPGAPIVFKNRVEMLYDLPDELIRCGLLAGRIRFPRRGPIPNVPVTWDDSELLQHGTTECPAVGCQKTGPDGVTTLVFNPKQEHQPYGYGPERVATGRTRSQSVFNAGAGELTITKPNRFQVNYHDSPEFDLTFRSNLDVFLHSRAGGADCTTGAHAVATMPEFVHLTYADVVGYHGFGGKYHYETTPRGEGRCYLTWSGSGDQPFEVVGGRIEGDLSLGQVPQITLPIRIGDSIEPAQGPALAFPPPPPNSFWSLWWKMAPRPEQAPKPAFTIPVTDWEYVGSTPGTVFARKRWPWNCGGKCTEETNMSLILTPPP